MNLPILELRQVSSGGKKSLFILSSSKASRLVGAGLRMRKRTFLDAKLSFYTVNTVQKTGKSFNI